MSSTNDKPLGISGQRLAEAATRSKGHSLRLDLRLYLEDNGRSTLSVPATHEAIFGKDDEHLVQQFRQIIAHARKVCGDEA